MSTVGTSRCPVVDPGVPGKDPGVPRGGGGGETQAFGTHIMKQLMSGLRHTQ